METEIPLLDHLTILSKSEQERIKAIVKSLPLIDRKIDEGVENTAGSTSNYSKPFWIYFRDTFIMTKESLSKQEESSIWLLGELDKRINRIKWTIESDQSKGVQGVMGKL